MIWWFCNRSIHANTNKPEQKRAHTHVHTNVLLCDKTVSSAGFSWVSHHVQGTTTTQPFLPIPPISHCVLMVTLPTRIMTSQALLPCRLCLTQFLQQPPCVSGKMDSVRQQQWFMGNSSTSEEMRCRRMNLWQIGEGEKGETERGIGDRNAYEKEQ